MDLPQASTLLDIVILLFLPLVFSSGARRSYVSSWRIVSECPAGMRNIGRTMVVSIAGYGLSLDCHSLQRVLRPARYICDVLVRRRGKFFERLVSR